MSRFYFKTLNIVSDIWIVGLPFIMLGLSLRAFITNETVLGIICLVAGLFWMPYALVVLCVITQNNMSRKWIDLSTYPFTGETFEGDYSITDEESKKMEDWFQEKISKNTSTTKYLSMAREIAIEKNLDARMYFALIHRAILHVGMSRSPETLSAKDAIKDKIEKLKEKLRKAGSTMTEPSQEEKESDDGGKYDFL